jgi:hypothetical protein
LDCWESTVSESVVESSPMQIASIMNIASDETTPALSAFAAVT